MKIRWFCFLLIISILLWGNGVSAAANVDEQSRLTHLQNKAAEALEQYYTDGTNWYRCAVLMRRIDRLEKE